MGIFSKKKTIQQPQDLGSGVAKASFAGTTLHVNPPPDVTLKRMESRLNRVLQSLDSGKWPEGSSKEMEFQTIKRRLQAQIAIRKGEI